MASQFICPHGHKLCKAIFDGMTPKKNKNEKKCGVNVFVVNEKNEILLGFDKSNDYWSVFSGKMDKDRETCLYTVAVRELKEEASINISWEQFATYIKDAEYATGKSNVYNDKGTCSPFFILKIANDIGVDNINKILKEKQTKKEQIPSDYTEITKVEYFKITDMLNAPKKGDTFKFQEKKFYNILSKLSKDDFMKKITSAEKIPDLQLINFDEILQLQKTTTTDPKTNSEKDINPINANQVNPDTAQVKTTTTTEETILYVDINANPNMMVSTIQLNPYFKKYTKKNGTWTEDAKGGNKRKSKSTKKARRSK